MRIKTLLLTLSTAGALLLPLLTTTEASQATTVKQVMVNMTIPASEVIFDAAADPPQTAERWEAVRKSAATLAESGQMLQTTGIAKDTGTWIEMAQEMVNQAQATLKAANAKDAGALSAVGDRVYVTCDTCHKRYMDK
jgi:hypothetical protein